MSAISTTIPAELDCVTRVSTDAEIRVARPALQPASRAASSPHQRADALHEVIAGVHADIGAYCNLRDLLEAQFEAALRHDTARLIDIGNAIGSQVAKLDAQRGERLALVQRLVMHRRATPAAMLGLFGTGPRQIAEDLWRTLEGLASECQLISARNGRLLADQSASLRRVLGPAGSDDSPGAARLRRLQREDAALDQYRDNIDVLTVRLHQEESLDGIVDSLLDARRLIGRVGVRGLAPGDFTHSASMLGLLRDQLAEAIREAPPPRAEAQRPSRVADPGDDLWVADGVSQRAEPRVLDMAPFVGALDTVIPLFGQSAGRRDEVAWRVQIDRTLLDLDSGLDSLALCTASLVSTRHLLQGLSDNHTNLSLSNKHLAMSLGQLDDDAALLLLQGHEIALHASRTAQLALAELSLFEDR